MMFLHYVNIPNPYVTTLRTASENILTYHVNKPIVNYHVPLYIGMSNVNTIKRIVNYDLPIDISMLNLTIIKHIVNYDVRIYILVWQMLIQLTIL